MKAVNFFALTNLTVEHMFFDVFPMIKDELQFGFYNLTEAEL